MSNILQIHDIKLSDMFSVEEISNYIDKLSHVKACKRKFKKRYEKGDSIIGRIYSANDNKNYLIYSCYECGGTYRIEGVAPTIFDSKKGC